MKKLDLDYLQFVADQLREYKDVDFYEKWFKNKENNRMLHALQESIGRGAKHVSIPLYIYTIVPLLFTNWLLIKFSQWFYRFMTNQFRILGGPMNEWIIIISILFW